MKIKIIRSIALVILLNAIFSAHSALSLEGDIYGHDKALSEILGEELTICTADGIEKVTSEEYVGLLNSFYLKEDEQKNLIDYSAFLPNHGGNSLFLQLSLRVKTRIAGACYFSNDCSFSQSRAPPAIV